MTLSTALLVSAVQEGLAGHFTQHRRALKLSTGTGENTLLAERLRGVEGLSEGFRFQIAALSLDAAVPLKFLIGQPVLVELLPTDNFDQSRPFHGHVTAAELTGSNSGFARYQLTIEPWTRFLGMGRDSRVFQDKTVLDILDTVFRSYDNKGRLAPAWRFDLLDRSVYPKRSLTTQYQESDLAFVERLMNEEGLFYFFEHQAKSDSPSFGSHTLVIADHNGAFARNSQPDVRFTRVGAAMQEDSIDRWRTELRCETNAIELSSWDYRSRSRRDVSRSADESSSLVSRDAPGEYAYSTRQQGLRIAENQLQALQARKEVHTGAGTVRTFAPGTRFTLHGHSLFDGGENAGFTIVRVRHLAHNNLDADTADALTRMLGQCALMQANDTDLASSLHAVGRGPGERPVYRNRIDAIPSCVPYRPSRTDGQGQLLHPHPQVRGQQTAIVVGPPGAVIHTDRDHRIKVQFHWQRGTASHSRLLHPAPDGHSGAPGDDQAGTWVRVATSLATIAGANWGGHALPRVGQEVLVDFLEGNVDRPVVIGALYNGAGQQDAQHNRFAYGGGAATGNAPMWFPGEAGAHAHPAALSGIKSQAMQSSQDGTGSYSQLVFDDTANQARVSLQHHAKPHEGTAELNLGQLRHQTDNQRLAPTGFGAELKTGHAAALRAGRGMLLSTDLGSTSGAQLDSAPAAMQIEQSAQLLTDLAGTAQKHNAQLEGEGKPDELAAGRDLQRSGETVRFRSEGSAGDDRPGNAIAYNAPHLQLSAPLGIAAMTPSSAVFSAGASLSLVAHQDINTVSQAGLFHSVRSGIGLFTYGKATAADKPNKETGMRLHAASGKVSSQSQSGPTRITADKTVTVASVAKSVTVAAKEHVLLTAQGAYIKLSGGNIELHGPGAIRFKATMKELSTPKSSVSTFPKFPGPPELAQSLKPWIAVERLYADGSPAKGAPYKIKLSNGVVKRGRLDAAGQARVEGVERGAADIEIGEDEREWTIDVPDERVRNPAFGKDLTVEQLIELADIAVRTKS
jgi:type VI secretion system secreted protein VgrG